MSHTYSTLEVSENTYNEISEKLKKANYDHAFNEDGEIDMQGIALIKK